MSYEKTMSKAQYQKLKTAYVKAIPTRLRPNQIERSNKKWAVLNKALKKLTIEELEVIEELIFNHCPDVPPGTCI